MVLRQEDQLVRVDELALHRLVGLPEALPHMPICLASPVEVGVTVRLEAVVHARRILRRCSATKALKAYVSRSHSALNLTRQTKAKTVAVVYIVRAVEPLEVINRPIERCTDVAVVLKRELKDLCPVAYRQPRRVGSRVCWVESKYYRPRWSVFKFLFRLKRRVEPHRVNKRVVHRIVVLAFPHMQIKFRRQVLLVVKALLIQLLRQVNIGIPVDHDSRGHLVLDDPVGAQLGHLVLQEALAERIGTGPWVCRKYEVASRLPDCRQQYLQRLLGYRLRFVSPRNRHPRQALNLFRVTRQTAVDDLAARAVGDPVAGHREAGQPDLVNKRADKRVR